MEESSERKRRHSQKVMWAPSSQPAPAANQVEAGDILDFKSKKNHQNKKSTQLNPDNPELIRYIKISIILSDWPWVICYIAIDNWKGNRLKKSQNLTNGFIVKYILYAGGTWTITPTLPYNKSSWSLCIPLSSSRLARCLRFSLPLSIANQFSEL